MAVSSTEVDSVRKRIANEALHLFLRYGVRSVKMDDIASELRMSERTIYEHYADKGELLSVCLKGAMQQQQQAREEMLQSAEKVIEGLFGGMDQVAESTREGKLNRNG